MKRNRKRKITEEKMWCCVCGLIAPTDNVDENEDVNEIEDGVSNGSGGNGAAGDAVGPLLEEGDPLDDQPQETVKEFVVTGSCKPELKISHISTDSLYRTAFPYEASHKLPSLGIHYMSMSSDSKTIAAVSLDGTLALVDVKKGVLMPSIGHNIVKNFFSAEFRLLSSDSVYGGCGNGFVYKYDTKTGELQQSFDTHRLQSIMGLCISPSGDYVACSDYDGYFSLFDGITGELLWQVTYKKTIRKMVFDPNERYILATCDDASVKLIDMPSGILRESLTGHYSWVMSVDVSTDGQRFVTGGFDGAVKVWDTRYTKCTLTFIRNENYNLWDVAFGKMNELVVSVSEGRGLCVHYC